MDDHLDVTSLSSYSGIPDNSSSDEDGPKTRNVRRRGPKPRLMDPASVARRARSIKKYYQRMQNETEEKRQERLASRKKYMKEYYKNLKPEEKERRLHRMRKQRASDFYNLLMTETEEERTKRLEYYKVKTKKKMMLMTDEQRLKENQRVSEYRKKRRRKLKERETSEEYEERRKLNNERMRKRILNETPEQRQRRLKRQRMYSHKRSQEMTTEQLEMKRRKERERRENMTEEQRQKKREQARLVATKRRRNETPEKRAERLATALKCHRRRMMQMTEAEREARIVQRRERVAKKRMQETEEEREKRLDYHRQYYKRRASRRKSKSSGECTGTGIPQLDGSQGNAEISETITKRPGRSAKSNAATNIRQQLEHEKLGVNESTDIRNSFNEEVSDLDLRTDKCRREIKVEDDTGTFCGGEKIRIHQQLEGGTVQRKRNRIQCEEKCNDGLTTFKSTKKQHEDSSMKLMEKWGLRPLMIRLKRIDVAETIQKIKDNAK